MQQRLDRATLTDVELEYELRGTGEPVVLIHPGHFADWFVPLMEEPVLTKHYQLVRYHRAGCRGSSRVAGPVSLGQHAHHCRSLMHHLGIERAHIVGQSSSGNVAIQLALDAPAVVQSLALLEPALMSVPSSETARDFVRVAIGLHRSGDSAGAIDTFLKGVCGPDYRSVLDRALPDSFNNAVADSDTFFNQEVPALREWSFTREDARRIVQPVLAVLGEKSAEQSPIWGERQEVLLSWFPNVEPFLLRDAMHLLQVQNPRGMAEGLVSFFARHPISASRHGTHG